MADGQTIDKRSVFEGRIVRLTVERVRLPDGRQIELEIVRHPGAAAIVPIDDEGQVLLVRQYRHAAGGYLLEVPAGTLDGDETPEACAHREVEEETGVRAGTLIPLGSIWTTPGFTDERIWIFLARDLRPGRTNLDSDELLEPERMPFARALDQVTDGGISDAKSISALYRAARYLNVGGS